MLAAQNENKYITFGSPFCVQFILKHFDIHFVYGSVQRVHNNNNVYVPNEHLESSFRRLLTANAKVKIEIHEDGRNRYALYPVVQ